MVQVAGKIVFVVYRFVCNSFKVDKIFADIVEGFLFLCMETLHDEFGFDDKRLNQFRDRLVKKIDCINADYVQRLDIKGNFKMIEK